MTGLVVPVRAKNFSTRYFGYFQWSAKVGIFTFRFNGIDYPINGVTSVNFCSRRDGYYFSYTQQIAKSFEYVYEYAGPISNYPTFDISTHELWLMGSGSPIDAAALYFGGQYYADQLPSLRSLTYGGVA